MGRRIAIIGDGRSLTAEVTTLLAESDWRDIGSAPKDGTPFWAEIPGYGDDNIIAWRNGLMDSNGDWCGGWFFVEDKQGRPEDWTDGVCWAVNDAGLPSTQPTRWRPLSTKRQRG